MKQLYKIRLPADVIYRLKKLLVIFCIHTTSDLRLKALIDFENSSAGHRKVMLRHQNTNIVTSL